MSRLATSSRTEFNNARSCAGIPQRDLRCVKTVERYLLIHVWIQMPDKEVGSNVLRLLVLATLVHPDWLPKQLDHVQNLYTLH